MAVTVIVAAGAQISSVVLVSEVSVTVMVRVEAEVKVMGRVVVRPRTE